VVVQCTSCNARFNAPSDLAGRKVRCRKCHSIFVVPRVGVHAGAGRNGKDVVYGDTLERLDADASASGRSGGDLVDPDELFQRVSSEFEAPRSNALYVYPMTHQVDRWLPFALALLPFAWACKEVFGTASAAGMPGWAGALRLTVILLAYLMLVWPACYWGVRVAARKRNYQLPYLLAWRIAAVFAMPYMFGVAMWLIAGQTSDFITGCILGLVMALPALWLLLRLSPDEGPITLTLAGGAFIGSTAIAAGVVLVFSLLANASADPANKPTSLSQNPLGPGLRWDRPPEPPKQVAVARPNPIPESVETPTDVSPSTPTPPTPATQQAVATADPSRTAPTTRQIPKLAPGDPFAPAATQAVNLAPAPVSSGGPAPAPVASVPTVDPIANAELPPPTPLASSMRQGFSGRYDAILAPPAPRSYIAVLTHAASGQSIVTRWDLATWMPSGEASFPGKESDFHLSSDGALVARITTFPSLSLQVYSFLERRFRDPVKLDSSQGEPTILGFAGSSLALIQWKRSDDGSSALEVIDAMAGKWTKRIPRIGNFERAPGRYAISDDGRLLALLTRDTKGGEDAPAAVEIYSLETTDRLAKTIPITDVSWKGGVVRISGLAISPGRTEVSLLLENEGRGLMQSWDVETGKRTRNYLEQAGLVPPGIDISQFTGNALNYVDGGNAWLIYGCSLYDVGNGQRVGALNLPAPIQQSVSGATCYIYHVGEQGQNVIHAVKIDTAKLRSMLVKRGK
jgi:hypothetical protein